MEGEERTVLVAADIKTAFDQVPQNRLRDVLRQRLPEQVAEFAVRMSAAEGKRGILQGGSLSPVLLNCYLDHFLDKPWRRKSDVPLLRSADDIVLCCTNLAEAESAFSQVEQMLTAAGMPLKEDFAQGIHNLHDGGEVTWLGYRIGFGGTALSYRIAPRSFERLAAALEVAHERPNSPMRAQEVVRGWLRQLGPCYDFEDRRVVIRRIRDIARERGFEELGDFRTVWRTARDRWQILRPVCRAPCVS